MQHHWSWAGLVVPLTDAVRAGIEPLVPERIPKAGQAATGSPPRDRRHRVEVPDRLAVGTSATRVRLLEGRLHPVAELGDRRYRERVLTALLAQADADLLT
jgi:hypothetical protein